MYIHTLEEACGYQNENGGTLNIITRQSEIYIVEMVESYHNMNNNDAEHLNEFTHRLRDESRSHIKDSLEGIKRIFGPPSTIYEEHQRTDKLILGSKLNEFSDIYIYIYMRNIFFYTCINKKEQLQHNMKNKI